MGKVWRMIRCEEGDKYIAEAKAGSIYLPWEIPREDMIYRSMGSVTDGTERKFKFPSN